MLSRHPKKYIKHPIMKDFENKIFSMLLQFVAFFKRIDPIEPAAVIINKIIKVILFQISLKKIFQIKLEIHRNTLLNLYFPEDKYFQGIN